MWNPKTPLAEGSIDVHAHLLPRDCYAIPVADGVRELTERAGELHLGDFPIAVTADQISSVTTMLADMDEHDIAVRAMLKKHGLEEKRD